MKKNLFFVSVVKTVFTLATVLMMSTVFASCSKDDEPQYDGIVTIDGVEKPILNAEYAYDGQSNFTFFLYLSADGKERVRLGLNKALHMGGGSIKLTEYEYEHKGSYWGITYYRENKIFFDAFGSPKKITGVFNEGSLFFLDGSYTADGETSIGLDKGRVMGVDKKEHQISIKYNGKIPKVK